MEGISVKTLYMQIGMSFVVFLYLLDNENTSLLILIPQGLSIGVDIWKLLNASQLKRKETFPYFHLTDKQSYLESATKQYDEEAMHYLSYVMYPLIAIYAAYSLFYHEHKGYYSFFLNSAVGCIYVFGFINMTP